MYTAGAIVRAALLGAAITASGCATAYHAATAKGGYSEIQLRDDAYEVTFEANAQTPRERVRIYALYRGAELTIAKGFDYFIITSEKATRPTGRHLADNSVDVYPEYQPPVPKHSVVITITLARGEAPAGDPKAVDARAFLLRHREIVKDTP